VYCLCNRVSHVVFPENMGPIAISKYPDIVILLIVVVVLCCCCCCCCCCCVPKMLSIFYSSIFI
jgi:hypothetical protein